jgi:hypothetical protein
VSIPKRGGVKNGVSAAVREALSNRAGQEVYISQLMRLLPQFTATQIRTGINNRMAQGDPIERIIVGSCWRWHDPIPTTRIDPTPEPTPTPTTTPETTLTPSDALMMVRVIGFLAGGDKLIQDTDTLTLYRCGPV